MALQKYTVSRDDSIYEAWPDVVQTDSGKLICVFSECEHHLNRTNARIMLCESSDRGRTWSQKRPLTEKCPADNYFNCARISKLRDGSLAIVCDRIHGIESEKNLDFYAELYIWYGDKEGKVWSEPTVLPFCGIVPDKLTELKNGRYILSAHFRSPVFNKGETYLWYSDDKGKNWSERVTIASNEQYYLCETSLLEYDNILVAFMRENSFAGCDILKAISYDNGESWSPVYHTPICGGHRPTSGLLQDGTVMLTYRYIPSRSPQNIFASFLRKEELAVTERKKQHLRTFPLDYDRNPAPDIGYSGWTQFANGEIYVVNYIKDDADKAYIRGYSFYPTDFLLPETENATKDVFKIK